MAKLDFPSSPTFNQRYPDPAIPGVPVYTWDTEKWVASGPVGSPPQAPFDAMAYSGMQINGGMEVSQEKGATVTTVGGQYICDGWTDQFAGTMRVDAGAGSQLLGGFPNHLFAVANVAQASLGAGDHAFINQRIEGYRTARLAWGTANAQPITLSFWTAHNRAGLYSGSIRNYNNDRCYAFSYTQAAASTGQYNSITIPGCTNGAWEVGNLVGIDLALTSACGTTYTAPSANTWLTGNYIAAPGQVNAVAATSDTFRITGVTVLPGTQAPTAAQSPNVMRPYTEELALCQRYYTQTSVSAYFFGHIVGEHVASSFYFFPNMRAMPTAAFRTAGAQANLYPGYPIIVVTNANSGYIDVANNAAGSCYISGAEINLDARF